MNALSFYRIVYAHFLLPEVSCKMFFQKNSGKNRRLTGINFKKKNTVISDVNRWVLDLHTETNDVKRFLRFFFFKNCFLLIPSSAPPIFSYFLARRIQFPTARHLGHGFGKQLVYDLIYTCSGRDFIDGYIILFLAHSSPQRKRRDFSKCF